MRTAGLCRKKFIYWSALMGVVCVITYERILFSFEISLCNCKCNLLRSYLTSSTYSRFPIQLLLWYPFPCVQRDYLSLPPTLFLDGSKVTSLFRKASFVFLFVFVEVVVVKQTRFYSHIARITQHKEWSATLRAPSTAIVAFTFTIGKDGRGK